MLCKDNQLVYFLLSRQYPNRLKGNYLLNADKSDCYLISNIEKIPDKCSGILFVGKQKCYYSTTALERNKVQY